MKLVNVQEMRRIEQAADAGGHAYATMMELAGQAVASTAVALQLIEPEERVLVLVGPGNNGGDGLVAARYFREMDIEITLYIWKRDIKGDANFRKLKQRRRGTTILWADNDPDYAKLREEIRRSDLIIDALLGTGAARPIDGQLAEIMTVARDEIIARRTFEPEPGLETLGIPRFPIMEAIGLGAPMPPRPAPAAFDDDDLFDPDFDSEEGSDLFGAEGMPGGVFDEDEDEEAWDEDWEDEGSPRLPWPELPVLALDCPSGLNCDTGMLDPAAIPASVTVTFACPKWGQLQFPGAGACCLLAVVDIGVPKELIAEIAVELIGPEDIHRWLPPRPMDAHKGTFGKALIAGGSLNYTGAAYLSAAAADVGRRGPGHVGDPAAPARGVGRRAARSDLAAPARPGGCTHRHGRGQAPGCCGRLRCAAGGARADEHRGCAGFHRNTLLGQRSAEGRVARAPRGRRRRVEPPGEAARLARPTAPWQYPHAPSRRDGPPDRDGGRRC